MSQHDFDIANQSAPNARSDINNALKALASLSSGSSAPSTTYANMLWYDTGNNTLKMRTEADDAWISVGYLDQSTDTFALFDDTKVVNSSGTQTGTLGDQAVKAAIVGSRYKSSAQTITSGGLLTLAHGLSETPSSVNVELTCTTDDAGYSIGDVILADLNSSSSANTRYNTARVDATNVYLRFSAFSETFLVGEKTTGNPTGLTNSSWSLKVIARI
jgi:hypothetical protein